MSKARELLSDRQCDMVMKKIDDKKIIASLGEGGSIAKHLSSFEPRQAQLDLLEIITRSFNEDALLAAEAGTGVGKSFAYLLPAIHFALGNKEKVVISTATITLQQQLFEKDIPFVVSAIGADIKYVLMKGRANFICLRRLEEALQEQILPGFTIDDYDQEELKTIAAWAQSSKTGSKAELSFLPSEQVWSGICSEADLCLFIHCPFRESCFIQKMRKEANNAHLIVVNHHLLFADLAARYKGAGYENAVILPAFSRLILDEAHTIENAATSFFSSQFSRISIYRRLSRLYSKRSARKKGLLIKLCAMLPSSVSAEDALDETSGAIADLRKRAEELDEAALKLCDSENIYRLSCSCDEAFVKDYLLNFFKKFRKSVLALSGYVRSIIENLDEKFLSDPSVWETRAIIRNLENAAEISGTFLKYKKNEADVLWIEKNTFKGSPWAVFTRTPLNLAPILRNSVFSPNKTVACLSATLAINNDFSYWGSRCGFYNEDEKEKRTVLSGCFPSPFPYSASVLLASPADAPLPDEMGYQTFVNDAVTRLVSIAEGSALVLFTSYASLSCAYESAKDALSSLGIKCLKQGDEERGRLLRAFVSDEKSCLFATDSFWEGVDAPGDTLRLVIICRLPFRMPSDPVFEARREALEKYGGNSFLELSLPQAVIKFKQGFGRLMRRSKDHGAVVVLDSRLLKKSYGRLFLKALPETKTSFGDLDKILNDMEYFLY